MIKNIKVETKEMKNAVKALERNIPKALNNKVFIVVKDNKLTLVSSNRIICGKAIVPCKNESKDEGNFGLNLKFLSEMLSKMEGESFTLTIEDKMATITDGKSKFSLLLINDEIKPFKFDDSKIVFERNFTNEEFENLFKKANFSCSKDEARPLFTGVSLQTDGHNLKLFATDTHILSALTIADETPSMKVVIPYNISSIVPDGDVRLKISSKMVSIAFSNKEFISSVLEGTVPEFERVIPKESDFKKFEVNKSKFLGTLDRIMICTNIINSSPVKIKFTANTMVMFADNAELGSVTESIPIKMDKELEGAEIGFAGAYLKGIKEFDSMNIIGYFGGELKPVLFKADDDSDFHKFIVTPVRLK